MTRPLTLCALLLAGCASGTAQPAVDPFQQIAQFTTDDLTAALADAQAHNDVAAANCYSGLLQLIPQLKQPVAQPVKGVFTLLQIKRDILASGPSGANALLKQLNIACAALVGDELGTAIKIGAIGAGYIK